MMRYTILTKGDSKSNALKHKMINHMKDFQMVEDSENPNRHICWWGRHVTSSIPSI